MNTKIRKVIRTVRFKFLMIGIMTALIILFFNVVLSRFNSTDPEPSLQNIDIERTTEFAAFTVHVQTGLYIRNFSYFSMLENKFVVDAVVWFTFDPDEITIDTIEQFSFENGTIVKRSEPDVKMIDGKMFAKYNVVIELKSNLEFCQFPLEDHRLSIVLTNNFVTPHEVMFDVLSTDFVVAPNIFVSNWVIKGLNTNFGVDENILNQIDKTKKIAYPKAAFVIDFAKAGIRQVFIIFAPIFLVFFFSLFAFFLTVANVIGRTTLAVSSVSALLGYRFVIENMMPKVGYFTTTDYVYIILLAFAFLSFIFHVVLTRLYNLSVDRKAGQKFNISTLGIAKDITFILIVVLTTVILGVVIV